MKEPGNVETAPVSVADVAAEGKKFGQIKNGETDLIISGREFKELFENFISFLLLIALLLPSSHEFTVED